MSFRSLTVALSAVLVMGIALAGQPKANDLYRISGIDVDVEASNAVEAREAAIALGESRALSRLWDRLVPSSARNQVPSLGASEVSSLVEDLRVSDEKTTSNSYIASLTVSFRPQAVRQLLREKQVPFAEQRSEAIIVLPVFERGQDVTLWRDDNPWLQAWANHSGRGLVPFNTPLGDASAMSTISAQEARSGNREALDRIAQNNGTDSVLVAVARESGSLIQLNAQWYEQGETRDIPVDSVSRREGEGLEQALGRAAEQISSAMNDIWKEENILRFDEQESLLAEVSVNSLDDWARMQRSLGSTSAVLQYDVERISRNGGVVRVVFFGGTEQLSRALGRENLRLEPKNAQQLEDEQTAPSGREAMRRLQQPQWRIVNNEGASRDSASFDGE
ncbi:DUF2066 domain-containing protein [Fodinicurvata fenggangensis]|uniref:DUF2066 domain-containing protein n=1 Tax=Fodinicurvata fenggangensis TaxID=1121830 RepID=UPI00047AB4FA|nr:DUF2066 domain-containing protein [Fodinicurvata fenggangensis]